jgi:RNA polymerase sigma factor for flagellar operon FliA
VLAADSSEVLERFNSQLSLVKIIAGQVARTVGAHVEFDELMSGGREGLLDAARRYDPTRGIPFRMYANYRVRGAMVDGVRKMSALPRRAYERLTALEASSLVSEGEAEHVPAHVGPSRGPGDAEEALADHLAAMATAAAMGVLARVAWQPAAPGSTPVEAIAESNPEEEFERAELLALVRKSLADLPRDESEIIRRHYFDGRALEDVAADLDMSGSWARRLHTRAMARLTKRLRLSSS